jgi:general secretion pathway protein I
LRACSCGGFSLLEVLVAFVILALVATALFRMFSGSLTNVAAADDYSRAVLVAESVLADAAVAQPLREGSQNGTADDGRIAWATQVTPYTAPQVNPDTEKASETMTIRLFRIVAEVTFPAANGKPRTLTLATVRVGARESR